MKTKLFYSFLFFGVYLFGFAIENMPKVDFSAFAILEVEFTTNPTTSNTDVVTTCIGQTITFTDASQNLGDNPDYIWSFEGGSIAQASTEGPHEIQYNSEGTFSASLTLNGTTKSITVEVLPAPNSPSLEIDNSSSSGYSSEVDSGQIQFLRCGSFNFANFNFIDPNQDTYPEGTTFDINWGDGSPEATSLESHIYNPGIYTLTYSIIYPSGCSASTDFSIYVGNEPPTITIFNSGSISCKPNEYDFTVAASNDLPGTIYEININDGSEPIILNGLPTNPFTLTHVFEDTSCGATSVVNNTTYYDAFSIQVTAYNPCSTQGSFTSVGPVRVSESTEPDFTMSNTTACVNNEISLQDITNPGASATQGGCSTDYGVYWEVNPLTGFTVTEGSLGSNNGFTGDTYDWNEWTNGDGNVNINFNEPGTYEVTLFTGNNCGEESIIKSICVAPEIKAEFELDENEACFSDIFIVENTSSLPGCNQDNLYQWNITANLNECSDELPSNAAWNFVNGTNQNSENPEIEFAEPGLYTLELVLNTNEQDAACKTDSFSQEIQIKDTPEAVLENQSVCIDQDVQLSALVSNCFADQEPTYNWDFSDLPTNISNSTEAEPILNFNQQGVFQYTLEVENECGIATYTGEITVLTETEAEIIAPEEVCANGAISLEGIISGATTTGVWTVNVEGGSFEENPNVLQQTYLPAEDFVGNIEFTLTSTSDEEICDEVSQTFVVEVQPQAEIAIEAAEAVCLNESIELTAILGGSATEVTWTSNLNGSFSDANAVQTTFNLPTDFSGEVEIFATTNNPDGACEAVETSVLINVLPTPEMQTLSDLVVCNTEVINEIEFTGTNADFATDFTWEFTDEIGLGQLTGTGNIPSFSAQNLTEDSFTTQVSVTPLLNINGIICEGEAETFNITIHPAPLVNDISLSFCEIADIDFSPEDYTDNYIPDGTTYTWSLPTGNENAAVSGASASIDEQSNFTQNLMQVSNEDTYLVYEVTPHLGSCEGATFQVEVYFPAKPEIQNANFEVCSGEELTTNFSDFSSNLVPEATEFTWTVNSTNSATGATNQNELSVNFQQTLFNETTENQVVNYTVTPQHADCVGEAFDVAVLVKPNPSIVDYSFEVCSEETIVFPTESQLNDFPENTQFTWEVVQNQNINGANPSSTEAASIEQTLSSNSLVSEEVIYQVTPWYDACQGQTFEVSILVNPLPNVQDFELSVCTGGSFSLSVDDYFAGEVPSNTQFTWELPTGENSAAIQGATAQQTPTNTIFQELTNTSGENTSLVYTITPETEDCVGESFELTVNIENSGEIAQQPTSFQQICVDGQAAVLEVELEITSSSTTYQWYSNTEASSNGAQAIDGATTSSFDPGSFTTEGNYFYYVQISPQGNECGDVVSEFSEIEVVSKPSIEIVSTETEFDYCQYSEVSTLTANASGGIGEVEFQWWVSSTENFSDATLISNANQDEFSPSTEEIGSFYYFVEVLQNNSGCNAISEAVHVEVFAQPEIQQQPESIVACLNDDSQELSVGVDYSTGNPSFQWFASENTDFTNANPIAGANQITFLPDTSEVGEIYYFVEVSFDNASCNTLISEPALVETIVAPDLEELPDVEICVGDLFEVMQFSNLDENMLTQFSWTNSNPNIGLAGSGTNSIPNFIAENNSTETQVAEITLTATSQYQGQSCGISTQTFNISVSAPIQANTTFSDFNGVHTRCETTNDAYIILNPSGGFANDESAYDYAWTGPDNFSSSQKEIYNLNTGLYFVEITDQNGCSALFEYEIIAPEALSIEEELKMNVLCHADFSGLIDVNVNGGTGNYTYYWEKNGAVFSTQEDISNLEAATYQLTVFDENLCFASQTFEITQPEALEIELLNSGGATCFGEEDSGFINIAVSGGVPMQSTSTNADYIYQWTSADGFESNEANLENLSPGIYTLEVTDQVGCSATLEVEIEEPEELVINYEVTRESCANAGDASIDLNINGGVAPYTINWENGQHSGRIIDLIAGIYTVQVVDANGCEREIDIEVLPPASYTAELTATNLSCFESNDGIIDLDIVADGDFDESQLQFTWSGPDGFESTTPNITDLAAGFYEVEIATSDACVQTYSVEVEQPSPLEVTYHVENASCNGAEDGELIIHVEGGTPPYFSNVGEFEESFTLEAPQIGTHQIEVMDANACEIIIEAEVTDEVLFEIPAPVGEAFQEFCIEDEPMLGDIRASGLEIIWFADYTLTEELSPLESLQQGETYYGINYNSEYGCESTGILEVRVEILDGNLEVRNLITVNGNELNTRMKIENIKRFPENKVSVFNRYGKLVWEADHYDNENIVFKGKSNAKGTINKNKALPTGTYFYVLQFTSPCGFKTKKGFVQIDNNS
ncbi:PKD-like domain-containing protein [Psychroflexus planctonicus]|nr:PKD-like domain-containing protein [Psychroflexus planctonicus]